MRAQTPFYIKKIRSEFERRKDLNPSYSLRAFAFYLGLDPGSLSNILKGNRKVSKNKIQEVISKLDLSAGEMALFKSSNSNCEVGNSEFKTLSHLQLQEDLHFDIISDGSHIAILSLIETENFISSVPWIAKRLSIPELRVQFCLDNLIDKKLIDLESGQFRVSKKNTSTSEDIPSVALKKARRQDLNQAQRAIDDIEVELRDLSSVTVTANLDDLDNFKKMIREFRKKFMHKAESKPGQEVYKLSIQLFPLTKIK